MSVKRKFFNIFAAVVMVFGSVPMPFLSANADEPAGDVPRHSKTVTPNGDGTYDITLSVTGKQSADTSVSKANVVIVFDTSNSMEYGTSCTRDYNYSSSDTDQYGLVDGNYLPLYRYFGNWVYSYNHKEYHDDHYNCASDRLTIAKNATTNLISKLLANNSLEGADNDTVEIALVNFATGVRNTTSWSTSESTLKNAVNGYDVPNSEQGGTNWETALSSAKTLVNNRISSQPEEPNYVIFVSDGDPTFRDSQMGSSNAGFYGSDWNYDVSKWGTGGSDPNGWNYSAAKSVADSIAALDNTTLYTVGTFGNVTNMKDLAGEDNYHSASDQQALESAFNQIVDQITNALSLTNVKFTDGITALTTAAVSGNPGNFTYTKDGNAWVNAPEAKIKTIDGVKTVIWDLGDTTLKDGETATVSFTVWPSQESYDILADLNNGKRTYASLSEAQKASIVEDNGSYSLQTNTEWPTLTYSTVETVTVNGVPTTTVSDPTTIEIQNDGPMPLDTRKLTLEKKWEDTLDPSQREEVGGKVTLNFYKDNKPYEENITLTEKNEWKLDNYIAIAPGIMLSSDSANYDLLKSGHTEYSFGGKKYIILETGHDYYFEEKDINNHFELTNYVYHPMIINNEMKNVFFTRDGSGNITGIEEFRGMDTVSATNTLKGGINIEKKVVDQNGKSIDTNDSFEITAHLIDDEGQPYSYDYRIYYGDKNPEYKNENNEFAYNDDGSIKYVRSKHKYGEGKLTETLYVGDTIRIVNVDAGVQYYVEETEKNGYESEPTIAYKEAYGTAAPGEATEAEEEGYYVVSGNTASSVTVTNKFLDSKTKVDFEKTWYGADGKVLSGKTLPGSITVELFKKGADGKVVSTGKTKDATADSNWKASFTDLPKYDNGVEIVYSIKESAIKGATYDNQREAFFEYDSTENNGKHAVVGKWKVLTLEDYILKNTWTPAAESVTGKTSFSIVKVDKATNKPLSGATFELKLKNGGTFTEITNDDGEATFDNLDAGEYTLKETNAPVGYKKISTEPNINITSIKKLNSVDLDNLRNNYEYVFSFSTSQVDGYEYNTENRTFTVKNEPIPYGEITASKVWDDGEDRDGLRKNYTNYYIAVRNNSGKYVAYEKLALKNKDDYEFAHLPLKTVDGEDITYEIVEASKCSGSGNSIQCTKFDGDNDYTVTVADGVVTNYHKPVMYGDLTVQKIWNDGGNELVRPTTIMIGLYANSKRVEGPVPVSAADGWKHTFKNLYLNEDGKPIVYSVQESELGGTKFGENESTIVIYADNGAIVGSWTKSEDNEKYEVTNTWKEAEDKIIYDGDTHFTIKKVDENYKPLSGVTFAMKGHSDKTTNKDGEITITVPISKDKKEESFEYKISEKEAREGYDLVDGSATITVTCASELSNKNLDTLVNTYTKTCEFDEEVDKGFTWDGEKLVLTVANKRSLAKSLTIKKTVEGVSPNALTDLGFTITGPEDFGENGTMTLTVEKDCTISGEIITCKVDGKVPTGKYTVKENNADIDYFTLVEVTGDNASKIVKKNDSVVFEITNKYEVEKDTYRVVKIWDDEHDKDGIRPTKLKVELSANGDVIKTKDLSAKNETQDEWGEGLEASDVWEYSFEDLPVADENAELIEYYAEEILETEEYEQIDEISGRHTTIFVNMHKPAADPCADGGGCGGEVPSLLPVAPETGKFAGTTSGAVNSTNGQTFVVVAVVMTGVMMLVVASGFAKRR